MRENEISGYSVESISIIETQFKRIDKYKSETASDTIVNIKIQNDVSKSLAKCKLFVKVAVLDKLDGSEIASGNITAYGIFKKRLKEPKISIDKFAALNAHAIMYPFVREHIASLSLKASMNVIMLPSINFVAFLNNQKQQESIND